MTEDSSIEVAAMRPLSLLRLRTLTRLRWFAVSGQSLVCLFVVLVLHFELPLVPLGLAIGVAALVNLVAQRDPPAKVLSPRELVAHLVFDSVQIGTVLALTGGIHNPFSVWLILAPMLAAFALEARLAWLVIGVEVSVLTGIALWHEPMPGNTGSPTLHTFGTWAALLLGTGFTAIYARQVAISQTRLSTALETTQAVLAREERLTAVGGLAAAAAHELGTPLGTILVTAREMEHDLPEGPLKEDALLLVSQAQRCQRILTRLSDVGVVDDARHAELTLEEMLREAAKPFLEPASPKVEFAFDPDSRQAPPERLHRVPAVIYAMRTLIENAVKFADSRVRITAGWTEERLRVIIEDDGPGFPADVLSRLGEPFPRHDATRSFLGRKGLGLGFFIAQTLLERTGASLSYGNGRRLPGAWVEIDWPISKLLIVSETKILPEKEPTS